MSIAAIRCWSQVFLSEKYKKKTKQDYVFNGKEIVFNAHEPIEKRNKRIKETVKCLVQGASKAEFKKVDVEADEFKDFGFTILEALSATGLRSVRYAKEIPKVTKILTNDLSAKAVESIKRNSLYNGIENIQPNQGDASQVLYQTLGKGEKYDVIDLDPYGSPTPFIDGAVQAVTHGGLLCVTATDLAVLAGSQPETCWAKYGGTNMPLAPYTHELALRLLLHSIQSAAARYKRSIEPLLCCSIDYYVRVFVRVYDSPILVKQAPSKSGLVYHCSGCKSFQVQPLGRYVVEDKKVKSGPAAIKPDAHCSICGFVNHLAGPFYSQPIQDPSFVARMTHHLTLHGDQYGTFERMAGMLTVISEELPLPFYYVLSHICGVVHCTSPTWPQFV